MYRWSMPWSGIGHRSPIVRGRWERFLHFRPVQERFPGMLCAIGSLLRIRIGEVLT